MSLHVSLLSLPRCGLNLALLCALSPLTNAADSPDPVAAVEALVQRRFPAQARHFQFELIPRDPAGDVFELETRGRQLLVRGNDGVALASGLNWYLKHFCRVHSSWCGEQLQFPDPLPVVPGVVRQVSPFRYRYCFNYCAFSYTLPWWDWAQWEWMLDWMALHGINLPLAVTGQEAIWLELYRDLGLADRDIKAFLVGPAFLPFGWMGCLDGWGGPLTDRWIEQHARLQQQILARARSFGMRPVLQGFTGHVPAAITNRFPEARLLQLPKWCEFPSTYFVDPQDPLFVSLGRRFIEAQRRRFGTDHFYAADTFIEMTPPSSDTNFLAGMARAVYEAMRSADPEAVWVLQGWLFVNNPNFWKPPQGRALFNAVPDDRLLALDLFCESTPAWSITEAFYGKPWVWCIIQNFGGTVSLHGALPRMAADLHGALTQPHRGKLSGIGLIFEGLDYNPIVQDFVTDMTWRRAVPDLNDWTAQYLQRRYGRTTPALEQAWALLRTTVYQQVGRHDTVICARPGSGGGVARGHPYDPQVLGQALDQFLAGAERLAEVETYQFDLVNLTRQVLGMAGDTVHAQMLAALRRKDREGFDRHAHTFLNLIRDLDTLMGTRKEFLLGRWLADARRWGQTDLERHALEWNARNLITLWGPPNSVLHEYASRQWSGMFSSFYGGRWEQWIQAQRDTLRGTAPFDAAAFQQKIRAWEDQWNHATNTFPVKATSNPIELARSLWAKYKPVLQKLLEPDAVSLTTGKPVSCADALPGFPAERANDGRAANTDQYWATDVTRGKGSWWQVDFERATQIGRVVVVPFFGDERHYGFVVELSEDGQRWETVADQRENRMPATAEGYTCTFTPRSARFLRVTQTHNSANTGRHLVEVMAFEQ